MLPFPNDFYTLGDESTPTGKRINFQTDAMPANKLGGHIDATAYNSSDGFSQGPVDHRQGSRAGHARGPGPDRCERAQRSSRYADAEALASGAGCHHRCKAKSGRNASATTFATTLSTGLDRFALQSRA